MQLEIILPTTLSDPSTITQSIEHSVKKYLHFDSAGMCIGVGASCDNTLPEDGVWCTDDQAIAWQHATLVNGVIETNNTLIE